MLMSRFTRRAVVTGIASLAVTPALAQFNLQNVIGGAAQVVGALTIDEDDEIKIGQSYYPGYLTKSGGAHSDRNVQEALQRFSQPFLATSARKRLPWEVTLVNNNQVNAWALPGGKIAVNSELVRYCDDPAELGSVIAHEVGHSEKSHGVQQMRNQAFLGAAGEVTKQVITSWLGAAGPLTGEVLTALEGPLYSLVLSGYSRSNEFEADAHILDVFRKTGQDPRKASTFFNTLLKLHPQNDSGTTSLFSTHPGTRDRIAKINEQAAKLPAPSRTDIPPGWSELKAMFPTPAGFKKG
jgi:predicted Zn-dependent protease